MTLLLFRFRSKQLFVGLISTVHMVDLFFEAVGNKFSVTLFSAYPYCSFFLR